MVLEMKEMIGSLNPINLAFFWAHIWHGMNCKKVKLEKSAQQFCNISRCISIKYWSFLFFNKFILKMISQRVFLFHSFQFYPSFSSSSFLFTKDDAKKSVEWIKYPKKDYEVNKYGKVYDGKIDYRERIN